MITLRYHVISICAVFLALALGVLLGATSLSDSLLSGISRQKTDLGVQVSDLQTQRNALDARLGDADRFATGVGPLAVRGALDQRTVLLIETATARQSDATALADLVRASGAQVTGTLQLTAAFSDPNRADQLDNMVTQLLPAGAQLPVASDAGTLTGGLLDDLLLLDKDTNRPRATPTERATALSALAQAGYVKPAATLPPAQLAIVLTGGAQPGATAADNATMLADFATQLAKQAAGVVLAGTDGSATGTGPVGVVRATSGAQLSTVDDVDTAAGRVVTVLALQQQSGGKAGAYGTAPNAQSPVPQPATS